MDKPFNPSQKFNEAKEAINGKIAKADINVEDVLSAALKLPGIKINREAFLRKELKALYPEKIVNEAIDGNPAQAGIYKESIDTLANQCINYETNKVSAISFAAGIPGGLAMAATIPADITQYFGFILRIMQKLAYLYGFDEFELNDENISDGTMNEIMIFLGVMFGVQEANAAVKIVAETASKKVAKSLAQKALTKGTIYPIVKKIATQIGFKMTKQVFANGVSKIIPIVGGVTTGTLTYVTFKPSAIKLKNKFKELPICDPEYYKIDSEDSSETS